MLCPQDGAISDYEVQQTLLTIFFELTKPTDTASSSCHMSFEVLCPDCSATYIRAFSPFPKILIMDPAPTDPLPASASGQD